MADQFYDFDAAWAEEDDEPFVLRLLGEEWKCKRPSEVPASLLLRMDRQLILAQQMKRAGKLPDDFDFEDMLTLEEITRQLAGDDNVDAWLARGLPYKRLTQVVARLMAIYKGADPDEGEAQAANREQRRAAAKAKASRPRKS